MKKITLSLIALGALSSAALAAGQNDNGSRTDIDPRDRFPVSTSSNVQTEGALAGLEGSGTSYDRVRSQAAQNENSGN